MILSRRGLIALLATTATLLTLATPASASPSPSADAPAAWVVTESEGGTPVAPDTAPPTNSNPPDHHLPSATTAALLPEDDLKQECRTHHATAASTQEGWMKDRFNRCFIGHREVQLRCQGCSTSIASVEFDYTLVGIAQNGTRQVDFYLTFDDWEALGGAERETTPMRVTLSGCGSFINCNPILGQLTQPLGTWRTTGRYHVTMTSANGTGIGDEFIARAFTTMSMAITPAQPNITPWIDNDMTKAEVRFDSAGARAGQHNGTVFSDFIPTFDLVKLARAENNEDAVAESIQHIDDALHRPERTFPSFLGKSVPGKYRPELGANQRPLHRLFDQLNQNRNRDNANKVCDDVWGEDAHDPDLNCDEFPFATTFEGAYMGSTVSTGNPDGWQTWNGSARLIGEVDNQTSGNRYLNVRFYHAHRILHTDPFFVDIQR
ncbi:hypothetical protein [Polymorphospora rubra]|uniref:hypothetical protein n=1 Tax=Polymorphospora rubra TaxID=338584 RepID=UPI0033F0E3D9